MIYKNFSVKGGCKALTLLFSYKKIPQPHPGFSSIDLIFEGLLKSSLSFVIEHHCCLQIKGQTPQHGILSPPRVDCKQHLSQSPRSIPPNIDSHTSLLLTHQTLYHLYSCSCCFLSLKETTPSFYKPPFNNLVLLLLYSLPLALVRIHSSCL